MKVRVDNEERGGHERRGDVVDLVLFLIDGAAPTGARRCQP